MNSALVVPSPPVASAAEARPDTPVIPASGLFQGHREVVIAFEGMQYRLRITSQNKLILTK